MVRLYVLGSVERILYEVFLDRGDIDKPAAFRVVPTPEFSGLYPAHDAITCHAESRSNDSSGLLLSWLRDFRHAIRWYRLSVCACTP